MLFFLSVLLATILVTIVTERFVKPKATAFSVTNFLLHSAIISSIFLVLTLIVQRPIFSALTVIIFFIIVVAVNNTKFTALKEPLVFSDFAMFAQAFKHPRLYFGFLGIVPVVLATLIIIGLIILVLKLEPAMPFTWQRIIGTLVAIAILLFLSNKIALSFKLKSKIDEDNANYGLVNTLFAYFMHSRTSEHQKMVAEVLNRSTPPLIFPVLYGGGDKNSHNKEQPNITVIQSESFFDARRLHPSINTSILKNFDKINAESVQFGKLNVPAWGANTMRTEFAFLTGIQNKELGFYRYYPYQFLAKNKTHSFASALKNQGYHCVCIHPHPASFFGRDRIFPKMGFDEFIDIDDFKNAEKFGPYISDEAVANKILEITKSKTDKPLFIFVITMENHGPLHLEKTSAEEQASFYNDNHAKALPRELNDLTVYLRHLKNADNMIKSLTDAYRKSDQETTLCFYGDHVPSMPNIYQEADYHDEHSDYFIWNSHQAQKTKNRKQNITNIESLAVDIFTKS